MIEIYKGDSKTINLDFTNDDGSVYNLSGATIFFLAKRNYSDEDTAAIINITITGHDIPESGKSHIFITTGDTNQCAGNYVAKFRLQDIANNVTTFNTEGLAILP
jgi:hypothetical protein